VVKKTYWLTAPDGRAAAPVEGADLRDQLTGEGWTECEPPTGNRLVWARNETHGGWATFPASVLHVWQARGWQPDVPPVEVLDPEQARAIPAVAPLIDTNPTPAADVQEPDGQAEAAASVKGNKRG
jgi:hypothetical protein